MKCRMVEHRIIYDLMSLNSLFLSTVNCEFMTVEQEELRFHFPTLRSNILPNT